MFLKPMNIFSENLYNLNSQIMLGPTTQPFNNIHNNKP
jgi:hypothetical protein